MATQPFLISRDPQHPEDSSLPPKRGSPWRFAISRLQTGLETGNTVENTWASKREHGVLRDATCGSTLHSPDAGICVDIVQDCQLAIYMGSLPLPPPPPTSDYKFIFKIYMIMFWKGKQSLPLNHSTRVKRIYYAPPYPKPSECLGYICVWRRKVTCWL